MSKTNTAILALLLAGVSAGFALCMSLVHYVTWGFVPPNAFREFQEASGVRTVPIPIALGISSLVLTFPGPLFGSP